ncbi:MAG: hypothetical protein Q9182_002646 [Xanthomendoza sp. 2 TL-2023]
MVYVALGLVIATLCSLGFAYKKRLWEVLRSQSRLEKAQSLPKISIGIPIDRHHDDGSSSNKTGAENSKTTDSSSLSLSASIEEKDDIKDHAAVFRPLQPERQPGLQQPTNEVKALTSTTASKKIIKNADVASSSGPVANSPKAMMPPPARPGPRLRPKANKASAPPSVPEARNTSTLGIPQTASSLRPLPSGGHSLQPPPSLASTLRTPPLRSSAPPASSLTPTSSTLPASKRPSKKVLLTPGHSPLDWAHLTSNPPSSTFLRGSDVPPTLIRVPPSLLKYHNGRKGKNAWGVWQGKVYNLTPYMDFHPGGVHELMKGAGREKDAERLFLEVHPWVNWEGLLGECLVGILVGETEAQNDAEGLDEMD